VKRIYAERNVKSEGIYAERNVKSEGIYAERNVKSEGIYAERNVESEGRKEDDINRRKKLDTEVGISKDMEGVAKFKSLKASHSLSGRPDRYG
jgi:hypothetical protein